RNLIRYGHLHGDAARHARHLLREEERHLRSLHHDLRPLRRERHLVSSVEALLHSQEHGISSAIREAERQHLHHAAGRLRHELRHDKWLAHSIDKWLAVRWWTPTAAQRHRDTREAAADLRDSLRA